MPARHPFPFLLNSALIVALLALTACSAATPTATTAPVTAPTSASTTAPATEPPEVSAPPMKVLLITGVGGLGDQGFNDAGNLGATRAVDELGITLDVVEPTESAEFEPQYRAAASSGEYVLIVGLGFEQAQPANLVAKEFPDQGIALIDSASEQPNVQGVLFREEENAFLAGIVAAYLTQQTDLPGINPDKVLGIVLGIDVPHVRRYAISYEAGARTIDAEMSVVVGVVGDFSDHAKAKGLSLAQIEQGADIVYQVAGGAGLGGFNAAEEKGVYAIGEGLKQNRLHPTFIVASTYKRMDNAVFNAIKTAVEGSFEGGNFVYGFSEGYLVVDLDGSEVPLSAEGQAALQEYQGKLAGGEITAPFSQEDLDSYLATLNQ